MKPSPYRDVAVGIATAAVGCTLALGMMMGGLLVAAVKVFDRKVPGERRR